jgi:hypothetical protein
MLEDEDFVSALNKQQQGATLIEGRLGKEKKTSRTSLKYGQGCTPNLRR